MEWISIEDRLPEENMNVLMYFNDRTVTVGSGYFSYNGVTGYDFKMNGIQVTSMVTHWMPLPEPPKD